jgi:6-phosphogluconolactonase
MRVYIGTYTRREPHVAGKGEGIYQYRLDLATGSLTFADKVPDVANPSFLALGPERRCLYCVNEMSGEEGKATGGVSAFRLDPEHGGLHLINQQTTQGTSPCHLTVDPSGRYLLVVNYGSGSLCVLPILEEGGLGPIVEFVQHEGSSINPQRQTGPHPHSVNVGPVDHLVYVPDLGLDKVFIYELDIETGELKPYHEQPWARTKSGAGPRHMDFHPSGGFAYVANELDSTVTVFAVDPERGTLKEVQTLPALPANFEGKSWCADIHVHPNGRFIYCSNRGHDSIAVFGVDESSGRLTPVAHTPTQGKTPRNFSLDPSGIYLLAANQNSDDIHVFRVDGKSGKLTPTGHSIEVPTPVAVKMMPRA